MTWPAAKDDGTPSERLNDDCAPSSVAPTGELALEIRQRREAAGLSQREAARALGVGYSTWRAYEYATRVPSGTLLLKLWTLLDKHQSDGHEPAIADRGDVDHHEPRLCPECGSELRPFADGAEWARTWFAGHPEVAAALLERTDMEFAPPASWRYCESCAVAVLAPVKMPENAEPNSPAWLEEDEFTG